MTAPEWASEIEPESVDFIKPNHRGNDGESLGQSRLEYGPPLPLKERLKSMGRKKQVEDVRPPKQKKDVPNKPGQFIEPVENFYVMLAMGLMPFKPNVSMVIISPSKSVDELKDDEHVEDIPTVARACAIAWDNAAQRNESVRRVLDGLTGVGVFGALIGAHMPIIAAAMADTNMGEKLSPFMGKEPANA